MRMHVIIKPWLAKEHDIDITFEYAYFCPFVECSNHSLPPPPRLCNERMNPEIVPALIRRESTTLEYEVDGHRW